MTIIAVASAIISIMRKEIYNKAFKTDSQRLAFSVLIVGLCVYGGMVKFRGSVAHTLIGR